MSDWKEIRVDLCDRTFGVSVGHLEGGPSFFTQSRFVCSLIPTDFIKVNLEPNVILPRWTGCDLDILFDSN